MAWAVTQTDVTVFGNKRVIVYDCTPDAATQAIATGLQHIDYFTVGAMSLTAIGKIYANSNASGVATEGTLGCSGFTSGDRLFITVYGR